VQTAVVNKTFIANMTQLWRFDPRLAQRLDELPLDSSLTLFPTKAGSLTASVHTADGRNLFLHSRYDPVREASEFCKSLERNEAACVVLCGLGLGYHIKALTETFGDEIVILVIEPDLVTIKTALENTDLSSKLATGRVEFIVDSNKTALHARLTRHATMLMLGTVFAVPPAAREHQADVHTACRQAIMDYSSFAKMSLVTLVKNGVITCRNIANNLPAYVSSPPADVFRNAFRGTPAILVAAGPSLSKNIEQLRKARDHAIIIAAQTTLKPLLARGIQPHFVTSLDYSDLSRQFFEGVDLPPDLILVAEPKASWHVIDTFRGDVGQPQRRAVLLDNTFAHRCVGPALAKRTPMEPGATVMHLAFYLAQWLGCDPIIFIGQDLAFSGHTYYTPGVAMHRAWQAELGRYCSLEMKEWERIVRHRQILRKIEDIDGRQIYTDEQMFTYLEQFERDFARSAARVIDATEGGARKFGAEVMPLASAIEQFCQRRVDQAKLSIGGSDWYDYSKLKPAAQMIASRIAELATFRTLCEETRDLLLELEGLTGSPAQFNRRIVRVDELRTMVQSQEVMFQMVRDVSQLGELQKFAADRKLAGDESKDAAKARRQLQRDRQFIDSLLEGCDVLHDILSQSQARFNLEMERMR
jgi:hypothetical protein